MRDASAHGGQRAKVMAFALFALALTFACAAASPTSAYAYDQNRSGAVAKVTGNGHDGHSYYAHSVKDVMNCISDMTSTTNNPLHESNITIDLMDDWNTKDYGLLKFEDSGNTYTINLHGYMINRDEARTNGQWNGKGNGEVIKVYKGVTVNIDGGSAADETAREHTGYLYDNDHFWKASTDNNTHSLYGGLITGGICDDENGAGGIAVMESATLNLSNVTVAGNIVDTYFRWWGKGGGISLLGDGAKLTMDNAKVMYNHAVRDGGGVYVKSDVKDCEIKLSNNSEISNNATSESGGGICDKGYHTKINISNSSLKNNYAGWGGGAIALRHSDNEETKLNGNGPTVSIYRSTISGNYAEGDGGGIDSAKMGAQITLQDTTVDGNTGAAGSGGGIYLLSFDKLVTYGSTVITNNKAGDEGGGIASERPSGYGNYSDSVTISLGGTTVVSGNTATYGGGIAYYSTTYLTFETNNVVVENNTASKYGGGIYGSYGGVLKNLYVRNNHAGESGGGFFYNNWVNSSAHTWMEPTQLGGRVIIESNTEGTSSNKKVSNLYLTARACLAGTSDGIAPESRIGFSTAKPKTGGGRAITEEGDTAFTQKIKGYSNWNKILYADDAQNYWVSLNGSTLNLYTGENKDVSKITVTVKTETDTKSATKTYYRGAELVLKSSDWGDPEYWLVEGFNGESDSFKLYPSGEGDEKCVKLGTALSNAYTVTAIYPNVVKTLDLTVNEGTAFGDLKASASSESAAADGATVAGLTIADSHGTSHEANVSNVTVDSRKVKAMTTGYSLGVYYQITVSKKALDEAGVRYVVKNGSNVLPAGSKITVNAQLKGTTVPITVEEDGSGRCASVTTDGSGNLVITTKMISFDNHVDVTYIDYFEVGKSYTTSVVYGSKVNTALAAVTKDDNWEFTYWSYDKDGNNRVGDDDVVAGDTTLYPQYEFTPDTFVYYAYFMDDEDDPLAAIAADDNGRVMDPGDPTTNTSGIVYNKEGYKFEGWYTDQARTQKAEFPIVLTVDNSEVTLYSKWSPKPVYVTFMAAGQSKKTFSVDYGSTLNEKVVPADPTLAGYTFTGWYADGTIFDYNTEFTQNTVFIADFERNDYLVAFDLDGGTVDGAILSNDTVGEDGIYRRISLYGSTLGELPVPKKSGYVFKGWYYNGKLISADTIVTENMFVLTEPEGQVALLAALSDEGEQATSNQGQVDGMLTAAWEKDDSSDAPAGFLVEVKDPDAADDEDDSLGGTFVNNGEKLDRESMDGIFGGGEYSVLGWYADEDCTKAFDFNQALTEDVTLYVKREKKFFTVTFSTGDGASKVDSQSVKYGELPTKPADPTRKGYAFAGWFADEDCTIEYDFDSKSMAIGCDVTLYAKWEKSGDVTPDDNGGKTDDSGNADTTDNAGTTDNGSKTTTTTTTKTKKTTPNTGDQSFSVPAIAGIAIVASCAVAAALFLKRKN